MKLLNYLNRAIEKWLRFYRRKSIEAFTGKKAENLTVLGKVYMRNANVMFGKGITLYPGVMFQGEGKISIGDNTFLGNNTIVYSEKGYNIDIGADCMIAAMCHIINTDHRTDNPDINMNQNGTLSSDIVIEDNVWLASSVTVLKGCHIRNGSVIGAKAVVNSETERNSINIGIPSRQIKIRQ